MCNIYDAMVFAWRGHKKKHPCKPPKQFELTQQAFDALTDARKAILAAGKYSLPPGWESSFYGTPVLVIEGRECFVVDHAGVKSSLGVGSSLCEDAEFNERRLTDN